jgi:hypothetical protein
MNQPIAVWQTESGWSAVIPEWQIDLTVWPDGSQSSIDANSVTEDDIAKWRQTAAGQISPCEWSEMVRMASEIRSSEGFSHYLLLMEKRVVAKEEFLDRVSKLAEAMARKRRALE